MMITVEKFLESERSLYPSLSKSCPLTVRFSVKKSNRFLGFTLAEVLITLGIIGIVAEMTIPTIVSTTKDQVLATQFKKSYSTFQQAMLAWENDLGCVGQPGSCMAGESPSNIKNYLKVSKVQSWGQVNPGEKRPLYYDAWTYALNGDYQKYILPDGSEFIDGGAVIGSPAQPFYRYTFDINGAKKGPNVLGIDRFYFTPSDSSALLQNYMKRYGGTYSIDNCASTTKFLLKTIMVAPNDQSCEMQALQMGAEGYYKNLRKSGVNF